MFIDKKEYEELRNACSKSRKEYKKAATKCIAYERALSRALQDGQIDYKTFQLLNELSEDEMDNLYEIYDL